MIFTDRKITIRNGKSSIDAPVVLYRGDFEVSIKFTIMESKFRFKSGVNLVDTEKASFGQLAILAPYGGNVFSEIVKCEDGTVTFTLTKEMIDQLEEVGLYSFQIRLFDYYRESRVSIPPVEFGIEVREPVASEDHDNSVNNAIVGYSIAKVIDGLNEDVPDTFDANGNYNKTDWETGDRISQGKLNKIEDALDKINQNEKNDVAALDKRVTNNFNVLEANKADSSDVNSKIAKIDDKVWSMKNMGQDVKEAMTGGSVAVVGKNAILNDNIVNGQVSGNKTSFIPLQTMESANVVVFHAKRLDDKGNETVDGGYAVTDFIKVEPNAIYTVSECSYSGFFDENKNFISLIGKTNTTFTTPANCHYIRLSLETPGKLTLSFEAHRLNNEYLNIPRNFIKPHQVSFFESIDISKSIKFIGNYYINQHGEELASSIYNLTDFIEVEPNTLYSSSESSSSGYYDENKNFISLIGGWANGCFMTPTNCRYVRMAVTNIKTFKFYKYKLKDEYLDVSDITISGKNLDFIDEIGSTYKISDVLSGCRLDSDGDVVSDSIFSLTPFYEVTPNTTYTVPECSWSGYFDVNHKYITNIGEKNTTFTTPYNCKYVRFSLRYPESFEFEAHVYAINKNIKIAYESIQDVRVTAKQTDFFIPSADGYYKQEDVLPGYYFNVNTGLVEPNSEFSLTPFYEVTPNTTYTVPECSWSGYFDVNYTYIDKIGEKNTTFTTPSNCKYVRFSLKHPESFEFYGSSWVLLDNVRVKSSSILGIENLTDDNSLIYPDLNSYNDSAFDEMLQIQKGNFTFAFSTDIHYQSNNQTSSHPDGLKHIMNACKIADLANLQFVAFGGDVLQGTNREVMMNDLKEVAKVCKKNMKVPYFFTMGNHDDASEYDKLNGNTGMHIITQDELHGLWVKPSLRYDIRLDDSNPTGNYFYKDFDNYNIRVIMLNAMDREIIISDGKPKYEYSKTYCYSQKQLTWLVDKALNFDDKENSDEWGIVVFTHVPFIGNTWGTMHNNNAIMQILKAFKNGGSVNYTYEHADFGASINVTFDKGHRDVIVIEGHNHKNALDKRDGIPYIQVVCSKGQGRTANSVMNDAFGIFIIDKENRTITVKAYGSTSDRTISMD